jgi:putative Mg2+ transporter-C (MgtC) family protein
MELPLHLVGRIVAAALLGLALGYERERHGHEAGTRTFAVLCTGAAAFGAISTTGFTEHSGADATRVASQVVVGVGFLGAGLIFRQGFSVQNLTTAAALWSTAAVGLAAGVGLVALATVVAAVVVLLLVAPRPIARFLPLPKGPQQRFRCQLDDGVDPAQLQEMVAGDGVDIERWDLSKRDGRVVVDLAVRSRDASRLEALARRLVTASEITHLDRRR